MRNTSPPRIARTILWATSILLGVIGVNVVGILLFGGTHQWDGWLHEHKPHFLAWRLCLYIGLAVGWYGMRNRVVQREPSEDSSRRLMRAEIFAAISIAAVEISALRQIF